MEPGDSFDRYVLFADLKPPSLPRAPEASTRTFLALDGESGEVVALQASLADESSAAVFLENTQRARAVELHGNPTLLSAGYRDGYAFVTHQWISGVSFREILEVVAPREELARVLAVETTRCLSQLHGNELVHADLHPDNLLLRSDGKLFLVGYMPRPVGSPATTVDEAAEAARYVAPEVLDGSPPSATSDVFSTGLVCFELFAGQRLLRSSSQMETRMDLEILAPSLDSLLERSSALTSGTRSVLARSGAELLDELLGQAPVPQAKPRDNILRGLMSQVPPQVTRQIYLRIQGAVEDQDLLRAVSELWRYASLVPRNDRTRARSGYLATMDVLWLCLLRGAGDKRDRVVAGAAAYMLYRLARTWGSKSLKRLAIQLCYRFTAEGNRLRELIDDPPVDESSGRELALAFRRDLETQPRSEKALLGPLPRDPLRREPW
jgi:serine/threonine protein kinase